MQQPFLHTNNLKDPSLRVLPFSMPILPPTPKRETALTMLPKGGPLPLLVLIWGILDTLFIPEIHHEVHWRKRGL